MTIGEVARRTGVEPSAIRYYEGLGLLPEPRRVGGKRRYDDSALDWLALIVLAREAGFTMIEVRELVVGFTPQTPPAERWQTLAARKLAELEALVARAKRMRALLQATLHCGCARIEDCGLRLAPVRAGTRAAAGAGDDAANATDLDGTDPISRAVRTRRGDGDRGWVSRLALAP